MLSTNNPISNNEENCINDSTMTWWGAIKQSSSKAVTSNSELLDYFQGRLVTAADCGSQNCNWLNVLLLLSILTSIVSYLVFFERQSKHQQDTILLDWIVYCISSPQSICHFFQVPFDGNVNDIQAHFLCSKGLQIIMNIRTYQWAQLHCVLTSSSILPADGRCGNGNAKIQADDPR